MKKSLLYVLITAVAFSTLEPFSSLPAFAGVSAFSITAIRFVIGSLMLLPFSIAAVRKKHVKIGKRDWAILAGLGVLVICVSMNLLQIAVQIVRESGKTPANVAILFCSNSLFTIFLSAWLLHDRLDRQKLLAAGLGVVGLFFCIDFSGSDGLLSSLLTLLAAITFSLYTVLSKKYAARLSGIIQTGLSFLIGSAVLVVGLLLSGMDLLENVGTHNLLDMLYLGVVVTGIGYAAFFKGIEEWSTMAASLVFFIKPVLTPFAVWLIKGSEFAPTDWKIFAAGAFVVAGSAAAVWRPAAKA
ncbi:MAG: EamA family transporter [Oscillospiraceae bacterium]|nr:EamA family transporter [Oscillospiraceae bacterium]